MPAKLLAAALLVTARLCSAVSVQPEGFPQWLKPRVSLQKQSKARVTGDKKRRNGTNPAVYAVLVNTTDHYRPQEGLFWNALVMKCSAQLAGSTLPFHLIHAGIESREWLALLENFGWKLEDHSEEVPFMKSIFNPVYSEQEAKQQKRQWVNNRNLVRRSDGWATYFKFYAWRAANYDHILVSDLDLHFKSRPDDTLKNLPAGFNVFFATPAKNGRAYDGLNTHLMVITPSNKTFNRLVSIAAHGEYTPYTNTEQDVLETFYSPKDHARNMNILFPHKHGHLSPKPYVQKNCTEDWLLAHQPRDCQELYDLCVL